MKVFGYARRSSSEKSKSNYSIESQKRVCNELAARDNRTIEKWYIDEGYSGTTLKRPHMQEMLKAIAAADQEIIIYVWLASRLSRDAKHCFCCDCENLWFFMIRCHRAQLLLNTKQSVNCHTCCAYRIFLREYHILRNLHKL